MKSCSAYFTPQSYLWIFFCSTEQFAGFNPSSFGLSEPQPPAMFSQEGPGSEGPQLPMVPQKEMASFFQVPGEGAMTESPTVREWCIP